MEQSEYTSIRVRRETVERLDAFLARYRAKVIRGEEPGFVNLARPSLEAAILLLLLREDEHAARSRVAKAKAKATKLETDAKGG